MYACKDLSLYVTIAYEYVWVIMYIRTYSMGNIWVCRWQLGKNQNKNDIWLEHQVLNFLGEGEENQVLLGNAVLTAVREMWFTMKE